MYLSLFLLISEGRALRAVHREPPPLVLWSRTSPGGHQSHPCPAAGRGRLGQLCGDRAQGPASHRDASWIPEVESVLWWLFSCVEWSHQHSALGSVGRSNSVWGWKVWLPPLSCLCFCSPILVSPLWGQVVSGGSKWDFCWWLLSLCLQLELGNVLIHANIGGVSRGFSM